MDNPSFTSLNDWGTHKKKFFVTFLRKKKEKHLILSFFSLFFSFSFLKYIKKIKSYCLAGDVFCQINPKAPWSMSGAQHFCVFFLFLYTIVIITMMIPPPHPSTTPVPLKFMPYLHISVIFMNDTQNAHLNRGREKENKKKGGNQMSNR